MAPVIVGSPSQVADELEEWVRDTGIDGFNLAYALTPESFSDFVEFVIPELQRRGVYKREYAPGTLREKLFGQTVRSWRRPSGATVSSGPIAGEKKQ